MSNKMLLISNIILITLLVHLNEISTQQFGNTHWEPSSDFDSHRHINLPYANIQPTQRNVDKIDVDNTVTGKKVPYWEAFDLASNIGKILSILSTLAENPIDIRHSRFFEEKFGIAVSEPQTTTSAPNYPRNESARSSNNTDMTSSTHDSN